MLAEAHSSAIGQVTKAESVRIAQCVRSLSVKLVYKEQENELLVAGC